MDTATVAFRALAAAIENEPKAALEILRTMSDDDLNELLDGVDLLGDLIREVTGERDES